MAIPFSYLLRYSYFNFHSALYFPIICRETPNIVRIGAEHLLQDDPQNTYEIVEIYPHPEYREPLYYNDIALIQFDTKNGYHFKDDFACLPPEHLINYDNDVYDPSEWGDMEALGYGATSFGMYVSSVNFTHLPNDQYLFTRLALVNIYDPIVKVWLRSKPNN